MLVSIGFILLGLVLLVGGGELLVRGASGVGLLARLSPTVIGLTVVAAGTSAPELMVSLTAAYGGSSDLAIGNVVGSNILNIGLILGIAACVRSLRIQGNTVRLEWPVMMVATIALYVLARDGMVDRVEGGFLVASLVAFVGYAVWIARRSATLEEQAEYASVEDAAGGRTGAMAWGMNIGATLVGVGLLTGGAAALVEGAVAIARTLDVSEAVIGLTVVACGTSLPELSASVVAAYKGKDDIAVANVIGSNIFNVLGIAGLTSVVLPLSVPAEILSRDLPWMLGFSLAMFPLMRSGMRVVRAEGVVLLVATVVYIGLLVRSQG